MMRLQKTYFPVFFKIKKQLCFAVNIFLSQKIIPLSIYKHPTQTYPFLYHSSRMLILSCHDWSLHLEQIFAIQF